MRFIEKDKITEVFKNTNLTALRRYVTTQIAAQPLPIHPAFNLNRETKQSLEQQLLTEQKGLCCYCLQQIANQDFHIEHLAPQSAFLNEEVNYYNLFLSCGSHRVRKNHCGHYKGNYLIPKIMSYYNPNTNSKCEDLFKYNLLGEILPIAGHDSMANNFRNYNTLNLQTRSIINTIEILNLNCEELKTIRKRISDSILGFPDDIIGLEYLLEGQRTPNPQTGFLDPFCELSCYFLKFKIDLLN